MKRDLYKAFTLIELLIVLVILSIVMFIVTPRFISFVNPEKTKNFMLGLQNSLIYLSDKSILEKKVFLFHFDLDERRYYFTLSEEGNLTGEVRNKYLVPASFPEKLERVSVKAISGEVVTEGDAVVPFTPTGMLFSFEIRVEETEDTFLVLRGNSFNNRIQLFRVEGDKARPFR